MLILWMSTPLAAPVVKEDSAARPKVIVTRQCDAGCDQPPADTGSHQAAEHKGSIVFLPAVQDVISHLLIRDPTKRLGAKAGAEEIKAHPFFKGIQWGLIRHAQPPYVPTSRTTDTAAATPPAAPVPASPTRKGPPANAGFSDF